MPLSPVPVAIAEVVAAIFAGVGVIHLAGPRILRDAYARGEIRQGFRPFFGALALLTGTFLAVAETRIWGVALAAPIVFIATVMLLNRRKYLLALPVILVLAALPPTLLAAAV